MPLVTTLTLKEMRAATSTQILRDVQDNNTKREIVTELLGQASTDDPVAITRDAKGRIIRRMEVERDLLTGDQVAATVTTNTYHPTGEIDSIVVSERDANDKETSRRTITHFTDGRQPTLEVDTARRGP